MLYHKFEEKPSPSKKIRLTTLTPFLLAYFYFPSSSSFSSSPSSSTSLSSPLQKIKHFKIFLNGSSLFSGSSLVLFEFHIGFSEFFKDYKGFRRFEGILKIFEGFPGGFLRFHKDQYKIKVKLLAVIRKLRLVQIRSM